MAIEINGLNVRFEMRMVGTTLVLLSVQLGYTGTKDQAKQIEKSSRNQVKPYLPEGSS